MLFEFKREDYTEVDIKTACYFCMSFEIFNKEIDFCLLVIVKEEDNKILNKFKTIGFGLFNIAFPNKEE